MYGNDSERIGRKYINVCVDGIGYKIQVAKISAKVIQKSSFFWNEIPGISGAVQR